MFEIVKENIDEWDPIDLFTCAPDDEYDIEIKMIVDNMYDGITYDLLAKVIYNVFLKMFGADVFKFKVDDCKVIAIRIINLLSE